MIIIITIALYLAVVIHNFFGFYNKDFSITFSFFPLLYAMLIVAFFKEFIIKKRRFFASHIEKRIVMVNLLIIYLLILSFLINSLLNVNRISTDVLLFNLLIPLSIFLIQLYLWTSLDVKHERIVLRVFTGLFLIDIIVSIGLLLCVYVFKVVSPGAFYANNNYQTILFASEGGSPLLRVPGIFSSGATNASFILVFLSLILSRLFFMKNKRNKKYYFPLILVSIGIIFLTYTRRYIVSLFILLIIIYYLKLRTSRKKIPIPVLLVLFTLIVALLVGTIYIEYPALFNPDSLFARFYFWSENYNIMIKNNILHTMFGFYLLQQSLEFQSHFSMYLTDNSFLTIILHSGVITLITIIIYFSVIIKLNLRIFDRIRKEYLWMPAANILILFNLIFSSFFSDIIFNIAEIFFYMVIVILLTRVSLERILLKKSNVVKTPSVTGLSERSFLSTHQI